MSGFSVTIPALGRDGVSVQLVRWCKAVGDRVAADEPIGFLQVGTEVFLNEVSSPGAGVLTAIHVFPGDPIRAGQVVAHVQAEVRMPPPILSQPMPPPDEVAPPLAVPAEPEASPAATPGTSASWWQGLVAASACLLAVTLTGERADDLGFLVMAALGLGYHAASGTAARHWVTGVPARHAWTSLAFVAAAVVPAYLATTQPLAAWLARGGRPSADLWMDVLPTVILTVLGGYLAVDRLKPRGLAIVGLAAIGAALMVLSSTKPLTSDVLVLVAAFVAWPTLTFAEHHRRGGAPLAHASQPSAAPGATRSPLLFQHIR